MISIWKYQRASCVLSFNRSCKDKLQTARFSSSSTRSVPIISNFSAQGKGAVLTRPICGTTKRRSTGRAKPRPGGARDGGVVEAKIRGFQITSPAQNYSFKDEHNVRSAATFIAVDFDWRGTNEDTDTARLKMFRCVNNSYYERFVI